MTPRSLIEPARLAGATLLHGQSDERLVDLTRAGNSRAFETIVSRYRRPLLRYCRRLLPPERAEDAVQQAFLNAYGAIVEGDAELKLRPWLYRVAHNASLNLLRQNGWNHEQIPEDFDGVVQPPEAVEQSEHIREVIRAVKNLPERQRDAIVLRELEGRSYEEISVALGVSGGAVRQLLHRARTTLRAAATSITPPHILERLAERASSEAPTAGRIAEIAAGAGGAATLTKFGTVLVVAGAVAGGVAAGPLQHSSRHHGASEAAEAAKIALEGAGLDRSAVSGNGLRAGDAGFAQRNGLLGRAIEIARREHGGGRSGSANTQGGPDGAHGELATAGDHRGAGPSDGAHSDGSPGDGAHSGRGSGTDRSRASGGGNPDESGPPGSGSSGSPNESGPPASGSGSSGTSGNGSLDTPELPKPPG